MPEQILREDREKSTFSKMQETVENYDCPCSYMAYIKQVSAFSRIDHFVMKLCWALVNELICLIITTK